MKELGEGEFKVGEGEDTESQHEGCGELKGEKLVKMRGKEVKTSQTYLCT